MRSLIKKTRILLLWTEYFIHMVVFAMLILAVVFVISDAVHNFGSTHASILTLLNNALLLLVIKEIIWTVLRFFSKQEFTLSPFLYIGVMSAIREILFISIKMSIENSNDLIFSLQILVNAIVIFLMITAYYLFKKARINAGEDS